MRRSGLAIEKHAVVSCTRQVVPTDGELDNDGLPEGFLDILGDPEGVKLGESEGISDGNPLGKTLGILDGKSLGEEVGAALGTLLLDGTEDGTIRANDLSHAERMLRTQ